MNKNISFLIKLLAIASLVLGFIFPLLTGSVNTTWITDNPAGAPPDFSGTVFEIGIMVNIINGLEYNNDTQTFELRPATDNEFTNAMNILQSVAMIAVAAAIGFILLGALIHLKKKSKFASFLILLGVLASGALAGLTYFIQDIALKGMGAGGNISGNSVYFDNSITISSIVYTWRFTATLDFGYAFYGIAAAALLAFIALFLKGDYED